MLKSNTLQILEDCIHIVRPTLSYFDIRTSCCMSIMTGPSVLFDQNKETLSILDFMVKMNGEVSVRHEEYDWYCSKGDLKTKLKRYYNRKKNKYFNLNNLSFTKAMCRVDVLAR